MRIKVAASSRFALGVTSLVSCVSLLSACAHGGMQGDSNKGAQPKADGLKEVKVEGPVELKLKATPGRVEKVAYYHRALSKSFEDNQVRHQKEESLEFTSQVETVKAEPEKFTQVLTVTHKDGNANLHDFAMPEPGEKLEVTADYRGKILKSGDYPQNSIFFVPPISLPEGAVNVGDTWTMQASWLSLEEMVPFQLDMVSILKGFWACGNDRCAEIEIQGDVALQGTLTQNMSFKSNWRGKLYFAMNAGTVVWSRVDSEENMIAENVRRQVNSCLESVLTDPQDTKLNGISKPTCEPLPPPKETTAL